MKRKDWGGGKGAACANDLLLTMIRVVLEVTIPAAAAGGCGAEGRTRTRVFGWLGYHPLRRGHKQAGSVFWERKMMRSA